MSKNCELFINLCNFMKYLLTEILPDQDPTDSVKDAAQDVLSAIIKYTRKIEFEISPVFINYKTDGGVSSSPDETVGFFPDFVLNDTRIIRKEKCFQVTHLPLISISSDTESLSKELCKQKDMDFSKNTDNAKNKSLLVYSKEIKENASVSQRPDNNVTPPRSGIDKRNVDGFIAQSPVTTLDICSNDKNEALPLQKKSCNSNYEKNMYVKKKFTYNNNVKPQSENIQKFAPIKGKLKDTFHYNKGQPNHDMINSTKYQEMDVIFENNFLQFFFFSDLELNCDNLLLLESNELKTLAGSNASDQTNSVESELSIASEKLEKVSLIDKYLPPLKNVEDSIPCGFQAINGCVLSKLVKEAYYCWNCDTSVDTHSDLKIHFDECKSHRIPLKGQISSIFDICEDCVFSAIVPDSKINELLEYHQQAHETASKPLIDLYEAYSGIVNLPLINNSSQKLKHIFADDNAFVSNVLRLKKDRERSSDTTQFLGICLICKAFFFNTLEWSFHSFEFGHFRLPNEKYISCTPCCIVILGYGHQNIERHLFSFLHLSQCPLSKCEQSMPDKDT